MNKNLDLTISRLLAMIVLIVQASYEFEAMRCNIWRLDLIETKNRTLNIILCGLNYWTTLWIELCSVWIMLHTNGHIDIWLNFAAFFYLAKIDNE